MHNNKKALKERPLWHSIMRISSPDISNNTPLEWKLCIDGTTKNTTEEINVKAISPSNISFI